MWYKCGSVRLLRAIVAFLIPCSSSVGGEEALSDVEDITEDMELEQLHGDSAYDSFSSQGDLFGHDAIIPILA